MRDRSFVGDFNEWFVEATNRLVETGMSRFDAHMKVLNLVDRGWSKEEINLWILGKTCSEQTQDLDKTNDLLSLIAFLLITKP